MKLIDKAAVVAEIKRRISLFKKEKKIEKWSAGASQMNVISLGARIAMLEEILSFLNTFEVRDQYEQCVQYASIEDGIKAHAETYSFNIESELFNQLTKEQQKLWRKEIEQACISGGEAGVELATDPRYKENLEAKEVDLEKEVANWWNDRYAGIKKDYTFEGYTGHFMENSTVISLAKHFFELGLKAQKGEEV